MALPPSPRLDGIPRARSYLDGMAAPSPVLSAAETLLRDERAAILRRRRHLGLSNAEARRPPTVGLALSGGGIRSATFALDLLRGMAGNRLLERIDYLSSVSGGGFAPAAFTRLVTMHGIREAQEELNHANSETLHCGTDAKPAQRGDAGQASSARPQRLGL